MGAYAYAQQVLEALPEDPILILSAPEGEPRWQNLDGVRPGVPVIRMAHAQWLAACYDADLVVVAGWRKLVPILAPTVGFHSAKLPEYPGRAPVANAILRGDRWLTNTMLWLDGNIDSGDIIDEATFGIRQDPDEIYRMVGHSSALMLKKHWTGLLDGTAPRRPQDVSKRGPLTPADAWNRIAPVPEWIEAFG